MIMARPSDKAPVRKQEILEHFHKVLREEGIEGASLAKIARSMGVHPSLLIHYFSSKEQMTLALVDSIAEQYGEAYMGWITGIGDPEDRLAAILDVLFGEQWMECVDQSVFNACHCLGFRNHEIKKRFRDMYSRFADALSTEFERLMALGVIRRMDAARLADLVIAMTEGLDFYGTIIGTGERFDELGCAMKEAALALASERSTPVEAGNAGGGREGEDARCPATGT